MVCRCDGVWHVCIAGAGDGQVQPQREGVAGIAHQRPVQQRASTFDVVVGQAFACDQQSRRRQLRHKRGQSGFSGCAVFDHGAQCHIGVKPNDKGWGEGAQGESGAAEGDNDDGDDDDDATALGAFFREGRAQDEGAEHGALPDFKVVVDETAAPHSDSARDNDTTLGRCRGPDATRKEQASNDDEADDSGADADDAGFHQPLHGQGVGIAGDVVFGAASLEVGRSKAHESVSKDRRVAEGAQGHRPVANPFAGRSRQRAHPSIGKPGGAAQGEGCQSHDHPRRSRQQGEDGHAKTDGHQRPERLAQHQRQRAQAPEHSSQSPLQRGEGAIDNESEGPDQTGDADGCRQVRRH